MCVFFSQYYYIIYFLQKYATLDFGKIEKKWVFWDKKNFLMQINLFLISFKVVLNTVDPQFSDHKFSDNLNLVTLFGRPNLSFST